jgi:hypothetical protein
MGYKYVEGDTPRKIVTEYYRDLLRWIAEGAPHWQPYSRRVGVCSNISYFYQQAKVPRDLHTAANSCKSQDLGIVNPSEVSQLYPFNDGSSLEFGAESARGLCHTNKARLGWLRKQVEAEQ